MAHPFDRILLIVLDSVGVGAMPDAAAFGDPPGADTLGNVVRRTGIHLPHLAALGLAAIKPGVAPVPITSFAGCFGRCTLASPGKDTTTGHWEIAGIHLDRPFPLFPHGFPPDLIADFEARCGRRVIGNKAASGTEIIQELGAEHLRTGALIVYTSADSVFQIAAHEEIVPIPELFRYCEIARQLLQGPREVGRVIARPFVGEPGSFTRTANRHDYAVPPPHGMMLDRLAAQSIPVHSIGKIFDVYLGRGITSQVKTKNNFDGLQRTLEALQNGPAEGLIFVNLVDFDQNFGHRNDAPGYANALVDVDQWLPLCLRTLGPRDLLIITADHGCDPTVPGTDHTREYTPLIAYSPSASAGVDLGTRASLSDIGQTIVENFTGAPLLAHGESFLRAIRVEK